MELKDVVKEHLEKEKEQERLKRVKENSKLEKVTLLTNNVPYCNTVKEYLDQVAEADIDFILEKTMFGIFEVPTYEPSDDKKKSTFKKSDFEE